MRVEPRWCGKWQSVNTHRNRLSEKAARLHTWLNYDFLLVFVLGVVATSVGSDRSKHCIEYWARMIFDICKTSFSIRCRCETFEIDFSKWSFVHTPNRIHSDTLIRPKLKIVHQRFDRIWRPYFTWHAVVTSRQMLEKWSAFTFFRYSLQFPWRDCGFALFLSISLSFSSLFFGHFALCFSNYYNRSHFAGNQAEAEWYQKAN